MGTPYRRVKKTDKKVVMLEKATLTLIKFNLELELELRFDK